MRLRPLGIGLLIAMMLLMSVPLPEASAAFTTFEFPASNQTYQFGSWQGGGVATCDPTKTLAACDTLMQQKVIPTASSIAPWAQVTYGATGWCGHANTTTTSITLANPLGLGSPVLAQAFNKYQVPIFLQLPLDGYGQCSSWSRDAVAMFPDLKTYNGSGLPINNNVNSYVRVDDMNFAKLVYRDLINMKNNLAATSPSLIPYWYGVHVSSIGSDLGSYGVYGVGSGQQGIMMANASMIDFADSPQCANNANNATYGTCSYLKSAAKGTATSTLGHACCKTSVIYSQLIKNFHDGGNGGNQATKWATYLMLLGYTYAIYNFTQNYAATITHPFVLIPGGRQTNIIAAASYPYPYNTTYVKGLKLLATVQSLIASSSENGPSNPTLDTEVSDLTHCWTRVNPAGSAAMSGTIYGNTDTSGIVATNLGQILAAVGNASNTLPEVRMDMYYEAACAASSIQQLSSIPTYSPADVSWPILTAFGTILNRMKNIGSFQYGNPSFTASSLPLHVSYNGGTYLFGTNMTIIGGSGKPLLVWAYTNRTTSDTLATTLTLSNYHLAKNCIAVSALTWSVVATCSGGSTMALSVNIPARGWNPVYVFNASTHLQPLYSNFNLASSAIGPNSGAYVYNGPALGSIWAILQSNVVPASVSSNYTGNIKQAASLSALNATYIGQHWDVGSSTWQNFTGSSTQSGWWYDGTNHLLYVHLQEGKSFVKLTVNAAQGGPPLPTVPVSVGVAAGVAAAVTAGAYYFRRRRILEDWA